MPVPEVKESFAGQVSRVTLGATKDSGGTRTSTGRKPFADGKAEQLVERYFGGVASTS